MARHAALFCAHLPTPIARLAFWIVICRIGVRLMVRVMAGEATGACVVGVVALACSQPVGLKTQIGDIKLACGQNLGANSTFITLGKTTYSGRVCLSTESPQFQ